MRRQTKKTNIPEITRLAVARRDGGKCVICGNPNAEPNAHIVPRSRGGLGVPENIITLCADCHYKFDQTPLRSIYKELIAEYMEQRYTGWNENELVYRRDKDA